MPGAPGRVKPGSSPGMSAVAIGESQPNLETSIYKVPPCLITYPGPNPYLPQTPSLNWFLPTLALKSPPITNFSVPLSLPASPFPPPYTPLKLLHLFPRGVGTPIPTSSHPQTIVTTLSSNHLLWPYPIHSSRACRRRTIPALLQWITATLTSPPLSHTTHFSSALISVVNTISHPCLPISSKILRHLSLLCSLINNLLTFQVSIFLILTL